MSSLTVGFKLSLNMLLMRLNNWKEPQPQCRSCYWHDVRKTM